LRSGSTGVVEAKYELGKLDITNAARKHLQKTSLAARSGLARIKKAEELIAQVPDIPTALRTAKRRQSRRG